MDELLRDEEEMGGFLETPAAAGARDSTLDLGTSVITSVTEKPGDQIDRYKLLQKIGERQSELNDMVHRLILSSI